MGREWKKEGGKGNMSEEEKIVKEKRKESICGSLMLFVITLAFVVAIVVYFISILRGYWFLCDGCIMVMVGTVILAFYCVIKENVDVKKGKE